MTDSVDVYLQQHTAWPQLVYMHQRLVDHGFSYAMKWRTPIYMLDGKNLVGIGGFSQHCAMWFMHGVLLNDKTQCLINAQEGKTQALRQWRFVHDEMPEAALLDDFLQQVRSLHQQGITPEAVPKSLILESPLREALQQDSQLQSAFAALTPGRQRDYAEYIAEAKLAATRHKRLLKIIPMINAGLGLNDAYRKGQ